MRRADLRGAVLDKVLLLGTDLRGADLRCCDLGSEHSAASLHEARVAGCRLDGAHGLVSGPVDVGAESPRLLDGAELERWFAEQGAPLVRIREPYP